MIDFTMNLLSEFEIQADFCVVNCDPTHCATETESGVQEERGEPSPARSSMTTKSEHAIKRKVCLLMSCTMKIIVFL